MSWKAYSTDIIRVGRYEATPMANLIRQWHGNRVVYLCIAQNPMLF